jgi:mRNA interferase MazF
MVVRQGGVYWADLGEPRGAGPGHKRPCVVLQNNAFNRSALRTVMVSLLTTNLRRATDPGNVLLDEGEGGLPQRSVVNISQVLTLDKGLLEDHIGTLSHARVRQILQGLRLITEPRDLE